MIAWLRTLWLRFIIGEPPLDREVVKKLRERWGTTAEDLQAGRAGQFKTPPCAHCGAWHERACQRVKSMKFASDSRLLEVEFWPRWTQPDAIWPDEVEAA